MYIVSADAGIRETFAHSRVFFATLAHAGEVHIQTDKAGIGDDAVSAVIPGASIYIPFAELVDLEKELDRLEKEQQRLKKEIARSNGMLNNEKFVSRAPAAKVQEERDKLEKLYEYVEPGGGETGTAQKINEKNQV